jgi:hypothetical protein
MVPNLVRAFWLLAVVAVIVAVPWDLSMMMSH